MRSESPPSQTGEGYADHAEVNYRLQLNRTAKDQLLVPWIQGRPWQYFLTITYRTPRKMDAFYREAHRIESVLKGQSGFLAPEEHRTGRLHIHGLFNTYKPTSVPTSAYYWELLFRRFGRAEVKPIREIGGAIGYTTKYVTKALTDYWMW